MKRNSPDQYASRQATIYAILVPHYMTPGFAIPLARTSENSNSAYTPFTSDPGIIGGFLPLMPHGRVIELKKTFEVQIGHEEVFAVVDHLGSPSAGPKKEIVNVINGWINDVKQHVCQLNFALFCENIVMACDVGKKIYLNKASELGDEQAAARWFISAFICIPAIRILNAGHSQTKIFTEQRLTQSGAEIVIESPTKAQIYLPHEMLPTTRMQREYYRKDLGNTLKIANMCTGFSVSINYRSGDNIGDAPQEGRLKSIDNKISKIQLASPQEKRVAILISSCLVNPPEAVDLLNIYEDSSVYANTAVNLLLDIANNARSDSKKLPFAISKEIPRFVRMAYPRQRGRVILEFARELGGYPELSRAIKQIIYNSRQREIEDVSSEALAHLQY
ncbi:hypothetical protein Mchl_3900 [Methylorubrum extorquens CM4]|uniref:Uncharacterized protein n=2 Tax=Methylorubrum extorquens TaxID=408 RepID=B7KXW0_METC4|nr:hypothetical protein Mchl_3900 [Methylorubrum extorquens CM4]